MPLIKSSSDKAFKSNLKAELAAGKPRDQSLAIAYSVKRRAPFDKRSGRADGGATSMPGVSDPGPLHAGPVMSAVPGRTDKHNISVKAGSYVLPSSVVSSLGQDNTMAGFETIKQMFGASGPYGVKPMKMKMGRGTPKARPVPKRRADGGLTEGAAYGEGDQGEVPIVVAGGEYVLSPDEVMQVGGGDIARGHEVLDAWVKANRKQHIATLQKLPGPAKS